MVSVKTIKLEKVERLYEAAHRSPGGCPFECKHAACVTPPTVWIVRGTRKAPKGERVKLQHPHGWCCNVVADAAGNLPPNFSAAFFCAWCEKWLPVEQRKDAGEIVACVPCWDAEQLKHGMEVL